MSRLLLRSLLILSPVALTILAKRNMRHYARHSTTKTGSRGEDRGALLNGCYCCCCGWDGTELHIAIAYILDTSRILDWFQLPTVNWWIGFLLSVLDSGFYCVPTQIGFDFELISLDDSELIFVLLIVLSFGTRSIIRFIIDTLIDWQLVHPYLIALGIVLWLDCLVWLLLGIDGIATMYYPELLLHCDYYCRFIDWLLLLDVLRIWLLNGTPNWIANVETADLIVTGNTTVIWIGI